MPRRALVDEMVSRLTRALGDRLGSVVLYGPEAHGDTYRATSQMNLMIVLSDLTPDTLLQLGDPVRWWLARGQPWPRLFSEELIRDSIDVYPIEFLDITGHHRVLHGRDPVTGIQVDAAQLRVQCERDLREKLMRLREGYVACRGASRPLRELLSASFASFAPVWRGCLRLLGAEVPVHDHDVARVLCRRLGLDQSAFDEVARIATDGAGFDVSSTFVRYYDALTKMVGLIDRYVVAPPEESS